MPFPHIGPDGFRVAHADWCKMLRRVALLLIGARLAHARRALAFGLARRVAPRRAATLVSAAAEPMLEVRGVECQIAGGAEAGDDASPIQILKGLDLTVRPGEVHAIMGPNGSGKSTLSKVLARHPSYQVTGGEVSFKGEDLLEMDPVEAARAGIFLAFQYPVELPGVSNTDFLRLMVNEKRKAAGDDELDPLQFFATAAEKCKVVKMDPRFLERNVNEGFSGGEKKRNEILQMALLDPALAILDETDSGLDIDALRTISDGINTLKSEDNAIILITHYQRLLDYIKPDFVHVISKGKIIKTGGPELALELEAEGYEELVKL